jgi:hypothetical protein
MFAIAAAAAVSLPGCGSTPQWEITVENKGTSPCSVYITLGYAGGGAQGTSKAEVENISAGEKLSLLTGDLARTVESIRIVRGDTEQLIESKTEIEPGSRFVIVVPADGKASATLE